MSLTNKNKTFLSNTISGLIGTSNAASQQAAAYHHQQTQVYPSETWLERYTDEQIEKEYIRRFCPLMKALNEKE
jgi:hypothetical protein